MNNSKTQELIEAAPDLGVTIKGETNAGLKRIKKTTGLSQSMVANVALAYFVPRILAGEYLIVNGEIVPAHKLAA